MVDDPTVYDVMLLLKLELLLLQLSSYVGGGSCGYSQVLYSGGKISGHEVGTGAVLLSVKKGMVAPVDTQNTGADPSEDWACCWLCARAGPDALRKGTPDGSCWE